MDTKERVANLFCELYERTPAPKPTYTHWWYGPGGGHDMINILIARLKEEPT